MNKTKTQLRVVLVAWLLSEWSMECVLSAVSKSENTICLWALLLFRRHKKDNKNQCEKRTGACCVYWRGYMCVCVCCTALLLPVTVESLMHLVHNLSELYLHSERGDSFLSEYLCAYILCFTFYRHKPSKYISLNFYNSYRRCIFFRTQFVLL